MKTRLTLVFVTATAAVVLFVGMAIAQKGPIVTPSPPPLGTAATGLATPTCGGERALKAIIDAPKNLSLSNYKPAGGTSWIADLSLVGRVVIDNGDKPCSATGVRITVDEPEARAAVQACATMGASLTPGQHFFVSTKTAIPAVASPGAAPRLVISKAIEITCGIE